MKTSGCAFSISSSRMTRKGRRRTGFGEAAGVVVADVAGRRADDAADGVALLVLGHVEAEQRVFGCRTGSSARALAISVLPTPVGPTKMKEPIGREGSLRPARARRIASETVVIACVLADHAACAGRPRSRSRRCLVVREHAGNGDAGHFADQLGDVGLGHRLAAGGLRRSTAAALRAAVSRPGSASSSCLIRGGGFVVLALRGFFLLAGADRRPAALQIGEVGGAASWLAITEARAGFVDQVDRLVGQPPLGQVALR